MKLRSPGWSGLTIGTLILLTLASTGAGATPSDLAPRPLQTDILTGDTPQSTPPHSLGIQSTRPIGVTIELQRLPTTPGTILVHVKYDIPGGVTALTTHLPSGAERPNSDGFNPQTGTEFEWDRTTTNPQVSFHLVVNETIETTGPIAGRGDYAFVDVGDWALVRTPRIGTSWSRAQGGPTTAARTVTTVGPGAASNAIVFLGEHSEIRRSAHNQNFRLIIPRGANLAESPTNILSEISAASDRLRVGDRDTDVFMVAAPTTQVRWGVRGLQTGDADFWVRDRERLDTADNVWIHEYVHTRQDYTPRAGVRWFTEASASYYAALFALERNQISFGGFTERLAAGSTGETASAILTNPDTWNVIAPYLKGALVAGELDRHLRFQTGRQRSLQHVFGAMNGQPDPITEATYRSLLHENGGNPVLDTSDRFTTSSASPSMWDEATHKDTFGSDPALLSYHLPPPAATDGYQVSGPYREGPLSGGTPLMLVTDERLSINIRVENTGGAKGEYEVVLRVDGQPVDMQRGQLNAGATAFVTLSHRFTVPGEYTLDIRGNRRTVSVREPAQPLVTDLRVSQSIFEPGSEVVVSATVQNDNQLPAAGPVDLFVNDEFLQSELVRLEPFEQRTVTFTHTVQTPGEVVFRVGEYSVTVTVVSPSPIPTSVPTPTQTVSPVPTRTTTTETPGFGWVLTGIAILCTLLIPINRD